MDNKEKHMYYNRNRCIVMETDVNIECLLIFDISASYEPLLIIYLDILVYKFDILLYNIIINGLFQW
jgi:hypothetical protein